MENMNLQILKQPLGFLRAIQFIMSIFAFATTSGFSTHTSFKIDCGNETFKQVDLNFGYSFKLSHIPITVEDCKGNVSIVKLPWDFSSSAEFFVATGVLAFLFTLLALVIYIFCSSYYINNQLVPICDLATSVVLSVLWLSAASAWAHGVNYVKYYANPENVYEFVNACSGDKCETTYTGNYASLNVSLIFGFGNFLLWASSLWFVYKETKFHQEPSQQQQ
ncbi:synaptophysin-like [Limulus polyphemus]|uniref:Synaptophysin-like n=1 Tax=Limulus polyphemus TaxID=6850 RepID=A0ABM1BNL6_LIMPO|nr:synaptophysin-like [Limulus polyphemus]XP_022253951.1 synaptophysin-like [Limulus polyphemus]XP_022253952.1 synaptophysin-like [Limulus polyphemus]